MKGCTERDDVNFLKHTLAFREADGTTRLEYGDVKITHAAAGKTCLWREADAAGEEGDHPWLEMKNLKVEVVRYNPEVDTAPHNAFL